MKRLILLLLMLSLLAIPIASAGVIFGGDFPFIHTVPDAGDLSNEKLDSIVTNFDDLNTLDSFGAPLTTQREVDVLKFVGDADTATDVGILDKEGILLDWSYEGITHHKLGINITNAFLGTKELEFLLAETNIDAKQIKNSQLQKVEWVTEQRTKHIKDKCTGEGLETSCTYLEVQEPHSYKRYTDIALTETALNDLLYTEKAVITTAGYYEWSFDTPLNRDENGAGNKGTVYVKYDGDTYTDKQHSSWWNSTWLLQMPVYCWTNTTNVDGAWCMANGTNGLDTASWIAANQMSAGCEDVRFLKNHTTELVFSTVNCNTANTIFRINGTIPNNAFNYNVTMYFDNTSAVDSTAVTDIWGAGWNGAWLMHEDSATQATDYAGGGYTATRSNAEVRFVDALTNGSIDGSWSFNAPNDQAYYLDTGEQTAFNPDTGAMVWLGRIRALELKSNLHTIASQYQGGGIGYYIMFDEGAPEGHNFEMDSPNWKPAYSGYDLTPTTTSDWMGVAYVRRGNGTMEFYLNGELRHSANVDTSGDWAAVANFVIGGQNSATTHGQIDEMFVYDGALTHDALKFLTAYNNTAIGEATAASNEPPVIGVAIVNTTSTGNYTNGTINTYHEVSDPEADATTVSITIYRDGVLQGALTNYTSVHSGNTTRGQNWTFVFSPRDTSQWGANVTRGVIIRNHPPSLPTQSPSSQQLLWQPTFELSCTGSVDSLESDTPIYYEHWVANRGYTIRQNLTLTNYTHTFNQGNGTYDWFCRAHDNVTDTSGYTGNRTLIWNNTILTSQATGEDQNHVGGSSHTYRLNATYNGIRVSDISAVLSINGNNYSATESALAGTNGSHFEVAWTPPLNLTNYTQSFTWHLTSTFTNTTTEEHAISGNHNITRISLSTGCTPDADTWEVLNLSLRDEVNETLQIGDIDGNFQIWPSGGDATTNVTILLNVDNVNKTMVCVDGATAELQVNGMISYEIDSNDPRQFYIINGTWDNVSDDTALHGLPISLASGVNHFVYDNVDTPQVNYYIEMQRYDVAKDAYRLVAMGKTDSDGKDRIYLRKNDVFYKYLIKNNTQVVFTSTPLKVTTDDLYFTVDEGSFSERLQNFENIQYTLTFDNATDTITATWSTTDSTVVNTCLEVNYFTASASNTVCDPCLSTSSGTLTCNIGSGAGTWRASFNLNTNDGYTYVLDFLDIQRGQFNELSEATGNTGLILSLVLAGTMAFVGLWSPVVAILMFILGLFAVSVLGLMKISFLLIMSIGLVGVLLIWRIKS